LGAPASEAGEAIEPEVARDQWSALRCIEPPVT